MLSLFLKNLPALLIGAFATSYAEYKLNYNLYDLVKEKVFGKK